MARTATSTGGVSDDSHIEESLLEDLYSWLDEIPLSRVKKDIRRDFSDGVLVAEIIKHFFPRLVELHNYPPANKIDSKITNWKLLNRKLFKKLGFELADDVIKNVCSCKPWSVEQILMLLRRKIDREIYEQNRLHKRNDGFHSDRPEADQNVPGVMPSPHQPSTRPHLRKEGSYLRLSQQNPSHGAIPVIPSMALKQNDVVPKILVEEKEQEVLAKEETIQILQAKIRRLEHLLHLKDIRIDDLQAKMEYLERKMRPTALHPGPAQIQAGRR